MLPNPSRDAPISLSAQLPAVASPSSGANHGGLCTSSRSGWPARVAAAAVPFRVLCCSWAEQKAQRQQAGFAARWAARGLAWLIKWKMKGKTAPCLSVPKEKAGSCSALFGNWSLAVVRRDLELKQRGFAESALLPLGVIFSESVAAIFLIKIKCLQQWFLWLLSEL